MPLAVSDLQTQLAYRIGETSGQPSTSTPGQQRLEWFNLGYYDIARRNNWWWLEATDSTNTNTGSTTGYAEPADLKDFIELKIDTTYYDQIPYKQNRIHTGTSAIVSLPTTFRTRKFYRFGGRYYLIPEDENDSAPHQIKYFKRVAKATTDASTFLIPNEYLEALVAFAEARYWMGITQQAKAQAPFQEFEQMIQTMQQEQGRRGPSPAILEPEQAYG